MTALAFHIGQMRERVAFERRVKADDGMGNTEGEFTEIYRCAARIVPKMGGEQVLAARLTGLQPMLVYVRKCSNLADLATDWRLRNIRLDVVYNIKSFANIDERGEYFEILAVSGEAT